MVKLKLLQYFKAIVDYGSISAASERLYIAQPPLSKALSQLEEQLGVTLFERTSKGMIPTEAGRHLYQRATDLLLMAHDISEEMRTFSLGARGMIRIGSVSMGVPLVMQMIEALHQQNQDVQFSLSQGDTRLLEEWVEQRRIDAALIHLPLTHSDPNLTVLPLRHACLRVLCHQDSPLAALTEISLDELARYPLVLLRRNAGFGVYENILQNFAKHGVTAQVLADATDVPMVQAMVRAGMAVGVLPMLPDADPGDGLCARPVPEMNHVADDLVFIYRTQQAERGPLRQAVQFFSQI